MQGVVIVQRVMVGDPRLSAVKVGASQLLGTDLLAGGGLHEGRPAQEDGALEETDLAGHIPQHIQFHRALTCFLTMMLSSAMAGT